MRILVATFFLICGLGVAGARASDAVPQPLTRAGCTEAQLVWDDNANVCTSSVAMTAASTGQPLTREGCTLAGMRWDDSANVCDTKVKETSAQTAAEAAPSPSQVLIDINKAEQKMVVSVDGVEKYTWPVSTGRPGYNTPSGTFTPGSMNKMWHSRQWDNAPMPHAIFFTKRGHAIHGSYDVKHLGKPASHGCVRISPQNATKLYDLVADSGLDNTEVVLTGSTPGGNRAAPVARSKPRPTSRPNALGFAGDSDVQPTRRGGLFKRLFGRR